MLPVFLYSPLSPQNVREKNHPVLLLLFILKELFKHPPQLLREDVNKGPFAWTAKGSSVHKLQEFFNLLPYAFPELASQVPLLNAHCPIQELFPSLEPFILACGFNENLLLFLLSHQKELAVKPFLDRICPEGIDQLKEKIAASFKKRGYAYLRWTHSSKAS